ncbi:MAG TPA: glycosyltransferase, partial [Steroidobacteraceae bacterium]|nr:glycosyltransferase [Steroidobacteraceae bacterium]
IPGWRTLATVSVLLAALMLSLFYAHSTALGTRGRSFLAVVVYGTATAAVLMMYDYSQRYLTLLGAVAGAVLMVGLLGAIAILLAEAHEWVEARWSKRNLAFVEARPAAFHPKVSIHVPAFSEPAPMLIATLNAIARLDYPNFEVLVVDNNTPDENVWRPVLEHCARLGGRFKFFHVDPLGGFKAGALNYALEHTAPDADVIAVIDSDYQVEPTWLHDLVPAFSDPKVAIVQAPQDYRDGASSLFKGMTHAEYRGFFFIGMVTRNERNAIIQHGTMTLVRKEALAQVSGWAEWCITEDAELGLRLFEHGWRAHYIPRSYGRGLVPDTFADYKKQRFRWVYGAMQIVRAHREALIGLRDHRLTRGQRYHFIAGWLPWFAEGFNLLFNLAAIAWSMGMLIAPHRIDPPLIMFSVLPLSLFMFKMAKLAHLYLSRVGANIRQTIAAAIAGLALSHTVGLAVLKGLVTENEPFFRTPKHPQQRAFSQAITAARQELLLLLLLCATAYALTHPLRFGSLRLGIPEELTGPDISLWVAVLLIQAVPYAAALVVSVISATKLPAKWLGPRPSPIGIQSESKGQEPDATQSAHRQQ